MGDGWREKTALPPPPITRYYLLRFAMQRVFRRFGVPSLLVFLATCGACSPDNGPKPVAAGSGAGDMVVRSPIHLKMVEMMKPPKGQWMNIKRAVETDPPNWEKAQEGTKPFAELATALTKDPKPSKGSEESWKELTGALADSATTLDKAAHDKNTETARGAVRAIGSSCMKCHNAHRGPGGPGGGASPAGQQ
jgi:hypothetical protein